MNNLTTVSRKQIDTYDDSKCRCPQQEETALLLREFCLLTDNMSANKTAEIIVNALFIYFEQE